MISVSVTPARVVLGNPRKIRFGNWLEVSRAYRLFASLRSRDPWWERCKCSDGHCDQDHECGNP